MNPIPDARWWRAEKNEAHGPLVTLCQALVQHNAGRKQWLEMLEAIRFDEPLTPEMYGELDTLHYGWTEESRTRWPALASGCAAVHSKIAKSHPRPLFLTVDGDWALQNQAELATQWMDGEFSRAEVDELGERIFDDALTFGTGVVWVGEQNGRPTYERVFVGDLYVDPREERNDCVRSKFRVRRMDVGVLCEMFPEHKEEIEKARKAEPDDTYGMDLGISDVVIAYEAWRLPPAPGKTGRHTIAIDGTTLHDDLEWDEPRFPFAMCHWQRTSRRYFGRGLVEDMLAPQAELNEIADNNSESRHMMVPIGFCEEGSIQADEMDNVPGRMYAVKVGAQMPVVSHQTPMFLQMAQMEDIYIQRVWKLAGISDMSVASQKAPGVNSGVAIQNLADLESERFAIASRSWERLFIDIAKLSYRCAQRIAKSDASEKDKLEVLGGKDSLESIKFSDANLGDSPYKIDVFPVSQLSNTVAAKIDEVMSMVNAQLIDDPADARDLVDIPDLKRFNNVTSAGRKNVQKVIDLALKKGIATPADPYMPLPYLIKYGSLMCNLASMHGAPDANVQCLRDIVQQAIDLKQSLEPPAPPAMPAPGGAPMMPPGGPMPPDPMGPPPMGGPPPLAVVPGMPPGM